MQFPALMFTTDPTFNRQSKRWPEVEKWCKDWSIETDRIVYERSDRKYCAEASWQVSHFLSVYRHELTDMTIFHDAGGCYKKDGDFILANQRGDPIVFPSATHAEQSCLDNKLYAIAKNQWRQERHMYCGEDFSKQALHLLWCIDWWTTDAIKSCWTHNFLLDLEKPSLADCDARLKASNRLPFPNQTREYMYIDAYLNWLKDQPEEAQEEEFQALDCDLDGVYWQ